MYRQNKIEPTTLTVNESVDGETIEEKIERIVNNNEPIEDGAPIVYTERKDGVRPEYDIRTDRFEVALDAMTHVNKSKVAEREERLKKLQDKEKGKGNEENSSGTEANSDTSK